MRPYGDEFLHKLKDEAERIEKMCLTLIGLPPDSLSSLESRRNEVTTKELNKTRALQHN